MTASLVLAAFLGAVSGALIAARLRPRRVKVTRLLPLPETQPGRIHTDPDGREWVALQRTYDTSPERGAVLTVIYAEGGTPADPRVRYRMEPS